MPLTRVTGQKIDALVGHANGWRGRTFSWQPPASSFGINDPSRLLKNFLLPRLLKKAQMQGGARCEARGVLSPYVAAHPLPPRQRGEMSERANAADGPFSAAC